MSVTRISRRDTHWLGFYTLLSASWLAIVAIAAPARDSDGWLSALAAMCGSGAGGSDFVLVWGMWSLMSAAMMAPTAVPALRVYDDLRHAGAATRAGFVALLTGYLAVWIVYSVAGALIQQRLGATGLLIGDASRSPLVNAVLLSTAGMYQLSRLKHACLSRCRAPFAFFMRHWRPGVAGAARLGVLLGVVCVGCCWALMLLGLVGGTMSLAWMGAATLFMALEKLPRIGLPLTRPTGYLLLIAGAFETGRAVY